MNTCRFCCGEIEKIETLCSNLKIMGRQFPDGDYDVMYCKKCGLVQCVGNFSSKEFLDYYTSDVSTPFSYIKSKGEKDTYSYFGHILDELKPFISKDSTILDVGGSWGELAEFLMSKGYKNVVVADPNPKCVQNMEDKGIEHVKANSSEMADALKNRKFDMIIMNHILEHIVDINDALDAVTELLADDGHLFIEVPDIEGYNDYSDAPYFYLTYEHVYHFSGNDLINISEKYGLEKEYVKKYYKEIAQIPCVTAMLKKGGNHGDIKFSDAGKSSAEKYFDKCRKEIQRLTNKYAQSGEKLILWGIGASTAQLLSGFEGCNISQLIDVNPLRQGLVYTVSGKKYTIEAPDKCRDGKIIILSVPYEKAIRKYIAEIGLDNEIDALGD